MSRTCILSDCGSGRPKLAKASLASDEIENSVALASPEGELRQSSLTAQDHTGSPIEWNTTAIRALARAETNATCKPLVEELHSLRSLVEEAITSQNRSPRRQTPGKTGLVELTEYIETVKGLKDVKSEVESVTNYLNDLVLQFNSMDARVEELSLLNTVGNRASDFDCMHKAAPLKSVEMSSSSPFSEHDHCAPLDLGELNSAIMKVYPTLDRSSSLLTTNSRRVDKLVKEMVVLQEHFGKMTVDIEQLKKKQTLDVHGKVAPYRSKG